MKFPAEIRGVKLAPNKTIITIEVAPDSTGNLDGLQLLLQQSVQVSIQPLQLALNLDQE